MTPWIREKFTSIVTVVIIGGLALVFIISGMFTPSRTRGMSDAAVAAVVNGDPINLPEFSRAVNQRLEMYRSMMGGKITEAQLKQMRIREGVIEGMISEKLAKQAAEKAGLAGSDEEVRETIRKYPAFQKDGRFDAATYKLVLQQNQLTPGGFEKMVRDGASAQSWQRYFAHRVRTSEKEVENEFLISNDKRNIKYVLLTTENGRKGVQVPTAEIEKFLKDPSKLSIAKSQFEFKKTQEFKGKTFDQVKEEIARSTIASEKLDDIKKAIEAAAAEAVSKLQVAKSADAALNAALKRYGAEVKETGLVSRLNPYLPGIGEAKDLLADAFAADSPINGKAKKYVSGAWTLVAVLIDTKKPDLSQLSKEREKILKQLSFRKERELYEAWMKKFREKSSIDLNTAVISGSET
ncbi:MAG: SurA N-terminal domain-containing protein [Bdellovibrionales bacterium]|nr:SurA N-terminal domain-containing protein [Bdellovibrionales bacterium]